MPVLLYGAENWILTSELLKRLESFQGELAKRVLRWPRYLSNTAACTCIAVGFQSLKSRVLGQNLSFLQHVLEGGSESIIGRVLEAMSERFSGLFLAKECKELEDLCGVVCQRRF